MMVLAGSNIIGDAEVHDDVRPTESQCAIKPGDKALFAQHHSEIDDAFTLLEVLDASEYAVPFPDWETRLMGSYVLCFWLSDDDQTGDIGWFHRTMLIQITDEQHAEVRGWIENKKFPEIRPDWIVETYESFTRSVSRQDPNRIPDVAECEKCKSTDMFVVIKHKTMVWAMAGHFDSLDDRNDVYVPMSEGQHECETVSSVLCRTCQHEKVLADGQLSIARSSNIVGLLKNHHT